MTSGPVRRQLRISGIVQGVGFRPFVHELAGRLSLSGTVSNDETGVCIEVEGEPDALASFAAALSAEAPALAQIDQIAVREVPALGTVGFTIEPSRSDGARRALISPDTATCDACLSELFDPGDRRFRYPFVNCTRCGPRFTIIRDVPYDRPFTTMAGFAMCAPCKAEYEDPADRRFHAQPTCCPACGPTLRLITSDGTELSGDPIQTAARLLRAGQILAVKGLGGYHLAADATATAATATLRSRKHRADKPLALLVQDLASARLLCEVDDQAATLLTGPESPVVLLPRIPQAEGIAPAVAPGNRELGLMLPYTPLHHLLAREVGRPTVLTSGNVSDEPISYEDEEALDRLAPIADAFLLHNRPIHMRTDDSVVRLVAGRPLPIRRSRGHVPRPLPLIARKPKPPAHAPQAEPKHARSTAERLADGPMSALAVGDAISAAASEPAAPNQSDVAMQAGAGGERPVQADVVGWAQDAESLRRGGAKSALLGEDGRRVRALGAALCGERALCSVLAVGAELKSTFCLVRGEQAFVSHHIGDLENYETLCSFVSGIEHFKRLFDVVPEVVAHDLHPEYLSTKYALDIPDVALVGVQHHHAHIASCLADNREYGPVVGVAFDGLGYGVDGTLWGGEFLVADLGGFVRAGHLTPVPLPGGATAIREPWRMAAAYLSDLPDADDLAVHRRNAARWEHVTTMARKGVNAPFTSSAGRLFDAVAALLGVRDTITYEGQAAIELEQRADPAVRDGYRARIHTGNPFRVEAGDLVQAAKDDLKAGVPLPVIAARFHNAVATTIVEGCATVREMTGLDTVALSGGVFQNRLLLERTVPALEDEAFRVLTHQHVPPNDGGISLGQAAIAVALATRKTSADSR